MQLFQGTTNVLLFNANRILRPSLTCIRPARPVPQFSDRPSFRENKPKTQVFKDWKRENFNFNAKTGSVNSGTPDQPESDTIQ